MFGPNAVSGKTKIEIEGELHLTWFLDSSRKTIRIWTIKLMLHVFAIAFYTGEEKTTLPLIESGRENCLWIQVAVKNVNGIYRPTSLEILNILVCKWKIRCNNSFWLQHLKNKWFCLKNSKWHSQPLNLRGMEQSLQCKRQHLKSK